VTKDIDAHRPRARDRAAPCITSSFQAECVVLVHLVREIRPDVPVLFLDTVHHF
jgi:3'-phosphoadenosine 5'-phosphosulfate sulfotransferase (PAPS reductase)/FAD synthetase